VWLAPAATHFQTLRSFGSLANDGLNPQSSLIQSSDGALYGTTAKGGSNNVGTVFRLRIDGSGYSIVHSFITDGLDGQTPFAGLLEGSDGALYGTTSSGGTNGLGTVFKLIMSGSGYVVLHHFGGVGDGSVPVAALVEGSDGAIYGTTSQGGTNGFGTVFKLNEDGSGYAALHHFGASGDGQTPVAALLQASDGALYGTTQFGGVSNYFGDRGSGVVFRINKGGSGYSVVFTFTGLGNPTAALVEGTDGALYGTTMNRIAASVGFGSNSIAFKLQKDGSGFAILTHFVRANTGVGGLVEGSDGALYGTMAMGYDYFNTYPGIVFAVGPDSSGFSTLHSFDSPQHGSAVSLLRAGDGLFYGATSDGGDFGNGTLFRLWPPETPDLLEVSLSGNTAQLRLAGVDGQRYQLLRSTDLSNWLVIATITMPIGGMYTNLDSSLPGTAAYYRAAWIP
jgi:uncharacterized repeat protein (TIGR03803 family)